MLRNLRETLILSAAGRNLAIDLVETHGARATQVLETMLRESHAKGAPCAAMHRAQRVLESLH